MGVRTGCRRRIGSRMDTRTKKMRVDQSSGTKMAIECIGGMAKSDGKKTLSFATVTNFHLTFLGNLPSSFAVVV